MSAQKKILPLVAFITFLLLSVGISAQDYTRLLPQNKQEKYMSYLSNDCARGRSTGTLSAEMVAKYIKDTFIDIGLVPFLSNYYQPFLCDSLRARNVIGMVPANTPSDEYVIISAHYDHIGALNGFVYNGADDNGSGVTALLNIAELIANMKKSGVGPRKNIVFAAFDAKEMSMAGSRHFVKNLPVPKNKIICNINMDQIGTILEPIHKGDTNYVVILGANTLKSRNQDRINYCNALYDLKMDIDYTFYGSKNFTDIYYRLSDQVAFYEAEIPAILVTSGIHEHTYKITDDENIISYPVLRNRTLLVYFFTLLL